VFAPGRQYRTIEQQITTADAIMSQTEPVGVVIPVFNRRLKLIKTLETVVSQSKLPALLIVIDDGSTDGTADAAKEWLARNAKFEWRVLTQANSGVSVARNEGFAQIGPLPFVCFLDSDDLWPTDFIAEGLSALQAHDEVVAAVADRAKRKKGEARPGESLALMASNPLLWLICNDGGILSCTMIRSGAARNAGLFVPGMESGEDMDFLVRLFLLGGAAHSKAAPVLFVKREPLEPTEPPNLSDGTPKRINFWAHRLVAHVSEFPKDLVEAHKPLVRTAIARRWAAAAIFARRDKESKLALEGLLRAIWWDYDWRRRLALIWAFIHGRRAVLARFSTPYRDKPL
jgi:glycosyltransferase involved in cell wall biosynthesis